MNKIIKITRLTLFISFLVSTCHVFADDSYRLQAETLRDKIRGSLLGQILGNLNGLPHENEYIDKPGHVKTYTPALPEGARTDDDTDFEWVYVLEMQRQNQVFLQENVVQAIYYYCNFEASDRLRKKANEAGLKKPPKQIRLWK